MLLPLILSKISEQERRDSERHFLRWFQRERDSKIKDDLQPVYDELIVGLN